ncbi:Amuc_1102 family pilus-like protein [Roseibacillus ishigakijimensis]|uniref:Carbohydrate-binding domain-containing protein n=1 Tax=Roseibacillus ishigakijimensis TaxID=454146 RepID=A0A934VI93_9BACT|nr:Amuc_1102 family pilus-like protein [Roseibacillus ishigakijimensis]MBK1834828.1 hypothetical protein [Roseibacillus ishigakijimensis]
MHTIKLKKTAGLLLGLCFFATGALAQQVRVEADDPAFDDLQSPELGGNTGKKKWDPKDWLEAEVKLEVDARPEPEDGFIDRLQIRWYVAVKDPAGRGYFLLEKDVTYVNVPVGEDVYASVYLSPATIRRLTGGDRAGKSAVEAVAGIVSYNGSEAATFSSKSGEWWKSPSLSRTDKFPLMSKADTPFKFLWWDRYLEEQTDRR